MKRTLPTLALLALLASCGEEPALDGGQTPEQDVAATGGSGHGDRHALGSLKISDYEFSVARYGTFEAGVEGALEVHLVSGPAGKSQSDLNLFVWVEDQQGNQLSAPSKAQPEGGGLHSHVMTRASENPPVRAVLRLRVGDIDSTGSLPLDGHGHEHSTTPHGGAQSRFRGPDGTAGHLELKLHDDKGDLELWLCKDDHFEQPFDLPLDATVQVNFIDKGGRTVELKVRNSTQNEDESGAASIREGQTNYFIYPSAEGEDSTWLMGADFQSIVQISFDLNGASYVSEEFSLTPHVHLP